MLGRVRGLEPEPMQVSDPTSLIWTVPLPVLFLVLTVLLILCHEIGIQIRRRVARRRAASPGAEDAAGKEPVGEGGGGYLPAALGLLGLLIAFTFGMAIQRYDTRRTLVADEANAVRNAYLRIQVFDEPDRTMLSRGLLRWADVRVAFSTARDPRRIEAAEQQSLALATPLWNDALGAVNRKSIPLTWAMLDRATDLFNVAAARKTALDAHVPVTIMRALMLYALLCAGFMGYDVPPGKRFLFASTVQFALLALAVTMIVDLDRPRSNLGAVSQAPLLRAVESIRRVEAAKEAASKAPAAAPASTVDGTAGSLG
jgi:hypothetical protein